MKRPKILHVDKNHPILTVGLEKLGFENIISYKTPLDEIMKSIEQYQGIVIRSRFTLDKLILNAAKKLKFIARVGSGLENIDVKYAISKKIHLISSPEGNRNAVGEHALGLLLSLMNKLHSGHEKIKNGSWIREEQRGFELEGKTVAIIGYGNTGKSFAKKLACFNNLRILCYDIKPNLGDKITSQVSLEEINNKAQILSLHVPETQKTIGFINRSFIEKMKNPFWLINTSRGKVVVTDDLVEGLKSKRILGAGLDVLEYESNSFNSIINSSKITPSLEYLIKSGKVLLSPHVAGWTHESHEKLALTIIRKIKNLRLTN